MGVPEPTFRFRPGLISQGNATISDAGISFLRALLNREPRHRPDAGECLRHAWINSRSLESSGVPTFQPMLNSAKRCGAFDVRATPEDDKSPGSLDSLLMEEQRRCHGTNGDIDMDALSKKTEIKVEKSNTGRSA